MEFYADASSLLIALYDILVIIFSYINNFWAEQTLSKKMFFFKDLEESGLNVKKRATQIKELLEITGAAPSKYKTLQKKSTKENKFDEIFESSRKKILKSLMMIL